MYRTNSLRTSPPSDFRDHAPRRSANGRIGRAVVLFAYAASGWVGLVGLVYLISS